MIPWHKIQHFSKTGDKWSEDPDVYADPKLILSLDKFRALLGAPVHPSPVEGCLARFGGSKTSRHYVGEDEGSIRRKSDAIDVFCDSDFRMAALLAMMSGEFTGVGIYFDTHFKGKPRGMLHLDKRHGSPMIWFRVNGEYRYPLSDYSHRQQLFSLLANWTD